MKTKTCGECKFFKQNEEICLHDEKHYWSKKEFDACTGFEAKPVTNGDVIRQGGNRALAEFIDKVCKCPCEFCIYAKYIEDYGFGEGGFGCKKPDEKDCTDGFEAWLNAPADCVGKDTDVLTKESEGKDE